MIIVNSCVLRDNTKLLRSLAKHPAARVTWLVASQLMIADIVGVGVLSLNSAMGSLGWVVRILSFLLSRFEYQISCGVGAGNFHDYHDVFLELLYRCATSLSQFSALKTVRLNHRMN